MRNIQNYILGIAVFLCFIFFPLPCQAKEISKDIEITIPDNYVQCSFIATFEKDVIDHTVLIDPKGNEYAFTENIGGEGLKCTVKKVIAGTYHVVSTADSEQLWDGEGEYDENSMTADDLIGKITVTVKAEEESSDVVSHNIKIAKEIDGLSIYWKDDSIVVSWTDESIGNVNITVSDSKTLQLLAQEKVSSGYFEKEIDQSIEEILISVVPSESSSIDGAGNEYIKKVYNHPDATVQIEPYEYTNLDAIPAKVILNKPYKLVYTVNDNVVEETEQMDAGEYDVSVSTVVGENDLKIYVVDEEGNMRSTGINFIKDIEPPIIKILNDITGIKTYDDKISFEGTVEDFETLTFRNDSVFVDWDGSFEIEATLKDGDNELVLTATDLAGNEATYTAIVTKLVKEEKSVPWEYIISGFGILLIILLFFILRKAKFHFSSCAVPEKLKRKHHTIKRNPDRSDYIFLAVCVVAYLCMIKFVFQISVVSSGSMEPKINTGEVILLNKLAYTVKDPSRGDIVSFYSDEEQCDLLKRIIGIPGDTITFTDGYVFVNDTLCDEHLYLDEDVETNCQKEFTVPEGAYFVMGDNRLYSKDSRSWENPYIEKNKIIGKLLIHLDFH